MSPPELQHFLDRGYVHVPGILTPDELERTRAEFDRVYKEESPPPINQHKLLKHAYWLAFIEHPLIIERLRALFGRQLQLLQLDLAQQGPRSDHGERGWHRDFSMRGEVPLSCNVIVYLDDMTEQRGPTRVVPGSQCGTAMPPRGEAANRPLEGEVAVYAGAGDALFINSAIWHSGGRNNTDGLRRGIFAYYGYWWLKRYETQQSLPWQAFENASELRLRLLGVKMPGRDIHMFDPDEAF